MKSRQQNVSEGSGTISSRSCEPITITIDLIIEIFSRFPAKSIARYHCLSKFWSSTLDHSYFRDLFTTSSLSRPQILFAYQKDMQMFFFSMPQPQNTHDYSSSPVAASYQMKIPCNFCLERFSPINGFFSIIHTRLFEKSMWATICNPSTRQSLALEKPEMARKRELKSFLGYDPIEKQFKVLSMTSTSYHVLTLGAQNTSWRNIECGIIHKPVRKVICINGFLYYRATVHGYSEVDMVVCFDLRHEEFRFMKVIESFSRAVHREATLIDYNGKLGSLISEVSFSIVNGTSRSFELWVLEDFEKHEWSKHVHVFPPSWKNIVAKACLYFVGVISTNEIVFSLYERGDFCVFYYNINNNTVAKVEIQGMEASKGKRVYTFLNHVENLKVINYSV